MFAMADMRAPIAVAATVLLLGVGALFALRSRRPKGRYEWMLAATAFGGGPVVAMIFWALYVFTAEGYITNTERFEDLWPFLIIGAIVGTATALAITMSNLLCYTTSGKSPEQQDTR